MQPHLQLFLAPDRKGVLVEYLELREKEDTLRRRAYFLYANEARIARQRRPRFVDPAKLNEMAPIPVMFTNPAPAAASDLDLYAVALPPKRHFTLYSRGGEVSSHQLPVYRDPAQQTQQALLTPLALVADVTLVSAVFGLFVWTETGLYSLAQ